MKGLSTTSIHGGEERDEDAMRSVAPPIYQTASFYFDDLNSATRAFAEKNAYIYTRLGNPTVDLLERKIALLEGGESAVATSSGMAAISALFLHLLRPADHLLSSRYLYTSTYHLIQSHLPRIGVQVDLVDFENLAEIEKSIRPNTRAIFFETPANPMMNLLDIEAISELAHKQSPPIPLIVDNTFATPICQRPLEHHADFAVYSATKFLSGHGDTLGGIIIGKNEEIAQMKAETVKNYGMVLSPFNAWLILRGLCTLEVRMKQQSSNAQKIAEFLSRHPKVSKIYYPDGPLMQKQMDLPGAMLAFDIDSNYEGVRKFLSSVKICTLAVSLGDVRTLIQHPSTMTHSSIPKEMHSLMGFSERSLRMSVGLENIEDLLMDLESALKNI